MEKVLHCGLGVCVTECVDARVRGPVRGEDVKVIGGNGRFYWEVRKGSEERKGGGGSRRAEVVIVTETDEVETDGEEEGMGENGDAFDGEFELGLSRGFAREGSLENAEYFLRVEGVSRHR